MSQKTKKYFGAGILLVIVLLSFALVPMMSATALAISDPGSMPYVAEKVTERFLNNLGFTSLYNVALSVSKTNDDTVSRTSQYKVTNDQGEKLTIFEDSTFTFVNASSTAQYTYNATFKASNGLTYTVSEFCTKESIKNTITTIAGQTIHGPTEFQILAKETKTTGDTVEKQNSLRLEFSNTSGTYHLISNSSLTYDKLETTFIKGTGMMYQNLIGESGQYYIEMKPSNTTGVGIKATFVEPDGDIIDPGFSFQDWGYDAYGNHMWMDYYYWTPAENNWIGLGAALLGFITFAVAPPAAVSLLLVAFETNLAVGGFFQSSINGGLFVMYDLGIMWLDMVPTYQENGFMSDLYNGTPITAYEEFWYIATTSSTLWEVGFPFKHTSPWPLYYL